MLEPSQAATGEKGEVTLEQVAMQSTVRQTFALTFTGNIKSPVNLTSTSLECKDPEKRTHENSEHEFKLI